MFNTKAGWGPEQPDPGGGIPACGRGWKQMGFKVPSDLIHSVIC